MPTIKEIAEICGVSERAVRKYCERNHIGTYRNLGSVKRRNLSEPDIEALFRHYGVKAEPASEPIGTTSEPASEPIGTTSEPASEPENGSKSVPTIRELAEACGVSEQTIRRWCAKNGVPRVASQWQPSESDVAEMLRHYGAGVPKPTKLMGSAGSETNETYETYGDWLTRHYGKEVPKPAEPTKPGGSACSETNETCAKPAKESEAAVSEAVSALSKQLEAMREQLAVKDAQIADLSAALVAAQETAKAAQALHAADKADALGIEAAEAKRSRWQRLKAAWRGE